MTSFDTVNTRRHDWWSFRSNANTSPGAKASVLGELEGRRSARGKKVQPMCTVP